MSGRTRHFAACTNWNGGEGCDYTQPSCGACGTGMLVEAPGGVFECSDPSCRSKQPGCRCRPPRPMVVRRQKRTEKRFWGRRTHSLFRQGLMLYHHLPNWPEDRIRPLMEAFGNMLMEQRVYREVFGVI